MQGPIQPFKIISAGVVFVIVALILGAAAFFGLNALRSDRNSPSANAATVAAGEGAAPTGAAGSALNATEVGAFLGLPTQAPAEPPAAEMPQPANPLPIATPNLPPAASGDVNVDRLLAEMSLEEKIGQMIMTGVPGQVMDAQAERLIQDYNFGSVVYFGDNTRYPGQVRAYSQALQQVAASSGRGIPLFIAVDHEGGRVFRFQDGMTHFPNPMTLGAARSTDLALRVAAANAQELKAAGINLDLAPVLDVNDEPLNPVIGLRAFSGFADQASAIGLAYIQGLQQNGMISAAKHFPGHGSTQVDSHRTLPVVDKSLAQLEALELAPFRTAVQNGVGVVMVGHIALPQIDPSGKPASLSPVILQTLLRENLGYDGVVMTDAMSMGAIAADYSVAQAAVETVAAGCDLVAYTEMQAAIDARNALLQAVQSGKIPEARVNEAARRIVALKARAGLFSPPADEPAIDLAGHSALAAEMSRRAVSLVGAASMPLVASDRVTLITPDTLPVGSQAGDGLSLLGELLTQKGIQVDEWVYPVDDPAGIGAIQAEALAASQRYPQTVLVTWDALLSQSQDGNSAQVNLVRAFQAAGRPVLVIAAGSPFDLSLVEANGVGLAIYGGLAVQVEALAGALLAPSAPEGTIPVPLSR